MGFATKSLHAGHTPDAASRARAVPIYQTTSFTFENSEHAAALFALQQFGNIYTPHHEPDHGRVRAARGGARRRHRRRWPRRADRRRSSWRSPACWARATSWSPPARSTAARTRSSTSASAAWASTSRSSSRTIRKTSARRSRPRRKLLYGETIANPRMNVLDIEAVAKIAHEAGVPLVDRQHVGVALPLPADRVRRRHRGALGHEVPGRPRHVDRRHHRR